MGDHTESIQIDFDPRTISFEKLCELFWKAHNPCARRFSRQYDSILFYANDEQKKLVEATRTQVTAEKGALTTRVEKLGAFYPAEDYHQKYYLRGNHDILAELQNCYPKDADLLNSTAAARLNSYLSGNGKREQLEKEIGKLGLSDEAQQQVLARAR